MDNHDKGFLGKLRSFFGFRPAGPDPPTNDFRNPIWENDDQDDDDLFERRRTINIYTDPSMVHKEFTEHMQDMLRTFGGMFGDLRFFHDDNIADPGFSDITPEMDNSNTDSLRNYYLKPGYQSTNIRHQNEDADLDGKVSSSDISGLLTKDHPVYDHKSIPSQSYCKTIITTSIKKPDGTVETRSIIKNGNEVTEETTQTQTPDLRPFPGLDSVSMYQNIMSEFSSFWGNLH